MSALKPEANRARWESVWENSKQMREVHPRIVEALSNLGDLQQSRILEIGCGSAIDSIYLQQQGAEVIAADYSFNALKFAQRLNDAQEANLLLCGADLFHLAFPDETFDIVFSQGLLEHFEDPFPAMLEQRRVLKPGGYLCVDVPQKWSFYTLHKNRQMRQGKWFAGWETSFSFSELRQLMEKADLSYVDSYGHGYYPSFIFALRNFHTLDERYKLPFWLPSLFKNGVERSWQLLEKQRWFYRWMLSIGIIGQKPHA